MITTGELLVVDVKTVLLRQESQKMMEKLYCFIPVQNIFFVLLVLVKTGLVFGNLSCLQSLHIIL